MECYFSIYVQFSLQKLSLGIIKLKYECVVGTITVAKTKQIIDYTLGKVFFFCLLYCVFYKYIKLYLQH